MTETKLTEERAREIVKAGPNLVLEKGQNHTLLELVEKSLNRIGEFGEAKGFLAGVEWEREQNKKRRIT